MAVRVVNKQLLKILKERLYVERDAFIEADRCLKMLGTDLVCPDVTVDEFCSQAEYIDAPADNTLYGIRTDLKDRLYNVISDVLSQFVPCNHRRCA